jgi:hypothetical protein
VGERRMRNRADERHAESDICDGSFGHRTNRTILPFIYGTFIYIIRFGRCPPLNLRPTMFLAGFEFKCETFIVMTSSNSITSLFHLQGGQEMED